MGVDRRRDAATCHRMTLLTSPTTGVRSPALRLALFSKPNAFTINGLYIHTHARLCNCFIQTASAHTNVFYILLPFDPRCVIRYHIDFRYHIDHINIGFNTFFPQYSVVRYDFQFLIVLPYYDIGLILSRRVNYFPIYTYYYINNRG